MQNYEYKIKYKVEYILKMGKEVAANYKIWRADKFHKNLEKFFIIWLLDASL